MDGAARDGHEKEVAFLLEEEDGISQRKKKRTDWNRPAGGSIDGNGTHAHSGA